MTAKCLFQDLWKLGLTWDEEIPEKEKRLFTCWLNEMKEVKTWEIPRSYTGYAWSDNVALHLHAFSDASERGYGVCVYLVAELPDGTVESSLIMVKARVAPIKRVTLPRMELMGALLCARLLLFVKKALKIPVNTSYRCWTDSTVVSQTHNAGSHLFQTV
ncbi:Uncharacterised protein g3006 [Pycnogonum litorale]